MRFVCALVTLFGVVGPAAVVCADGDATVAVSVHVSSRTSLHVSTGVLEFNVPDGGRSASAAIEFLAGARGPSGSEVVLNMESPQPVQAPGGAADVDTEITFAGEGAGMMSGTLATASASVAAAWHGSGQRHGRIVFTLHASTPGTYRLPIQLVLTTP